MILLKEIFERSFDFAKSSGNKKEKIKIVEGLKSEEHNHKRTRSAIKFYMHSLKEGKVNKNYKIVEVKGEEKVVRRFYELGIFSGQKIIILNKSPLKKVFLVEIRGYVLSIKSLLLGEVMVV